jgi:RimJ/RimL family protein N-acetyltransferase
MHDIRHGEFVDLRPLRVDDAALTHRWRGSARAANLNRGAQTAEEQAQWISARPTSEYNFIIALKHGQPVGMVSLIGVDLEHRHAETARFLIGEEEAVRGLPVAVEAMKMIYELAFDELRLSRAYGTIASHNVLMMKWQKFLGMTEEGRMRSHYFINGQFQDAVWFGILEEEYRRVALPRMNSLIAAGRAQANAKNPSRGERHASD